MFAVAALISAFTAAALWVSEHSRSYRRTLGEAARRSVGRAATLGALGLPFVLVVLWLGSVYGFEWALLILATALGALGLYVGTASLLLSHRDALDWYGIAGGSGATGGRDTTNDGELPR